MGIEITVDSLEDMCLLMCDNVIPKKGKQDETRNKQHGLRTVDEGEAEGNVYKSRPTGRQD